MQGTSRSKISYQLKWPNQATSNGRVNERRIVESMTLLKRSSRVELARVCGLSGATITRAVQKLLDESILMECGPSDQSKAVGRPTTPLELDTRRRRFGLVQVGPKTTRLAMVPVAIPRADDWQCEFETGDSLDRWIKQVFSAWDADCVKQLDAVIVSLPGVVDEDSGKVLFSPNLRWTANSSFTHGVQVALRHDQIVFIQEIRALALGHLMTDVGDRDFLLVDAGSGLGAATVLKGRLPDRALPLSGEIGHTVVLGNQRVCGCGSTGCLETLVSRPGMLASAKENGTGNSWRELITSLAARPLPDWMRQTLDAAAVSIAGALNILGLRHVVLTGSFSELPQSCIEYLETQIAADAMWARFGKVACRVAPRRRQAGMISRAINSSLFAHER